MPLSSHLVGRTTEPIVHDVDARWLMAYAAALGDVLPCYLDTRRADPVVGHPLFAVCPEWPAVLAVRRLPGETLTLAESMRGVHAAHDLTVHRLARAGDRLSTTLTIEGIERRKPGAFEIDRIETVDANGNPVATTWMGSLFLGVDVDGPDRPADGGPRWTAEGKQSEPLSRLPVAIAETAAHVYTECARIWNPIHTDAAVAAAAGLPSTPLHGTATLALAVSRLIHVEAGDDPTRVRRIAARFAAMVTMPSQVTVRVLAREHGRVCFDVRTAEGTAAIRDGVVELAPPA